MNFATSSKHEGFSGPFVELRPVRMDAAIFILLPTLSGTRDGTEVLKGRVT